MDRQTPDVQGLEFHVPHTLEGTVERRRVVGVLPVSSERVPVVETEVLSLRRP